MNKEIKEKWLSALRSGEYQQGLRALNRKNNTFCCLGVLCDLHRKETNGPDWILDKNYFYYLKEVSVLPVEVKNWAGLNSVIPSLIHKNQEVYLARLNDSGAPFSVIADLIEKSL